MFIALVSWVIVGMVVGFIASKNVNLRGDDPKLGIACGTIGAVTGGIMHRIFSGVAIDGFNIRSLLAGAIGAVVVVIAWHVMRRRATRA
jgi:uncharacterized membrane protein YeaQ/YmgE (transglycosylase-associated protein family)